MGDVCEGAAVDEGGGTLQRLDQIGLEGVPQQGGHGPGGLEIPGGDGLAVEGIAHDDPGQPGLEVRDGAGQAQHRHDLRGGGDVEAVFPGNAVVLAAQASHDGAQLAVVHVQHPAPHYLLGVQAQGVALEDVVVHHGREKVVGGGDGVEVAGEMEVDVLHGDHLGIAAAGGTALDTEHRT